MTCSRCGWEMPNPGCYVCGPDHPDHKEQEGNMHDTIKALYEEIDQLGRIGIMIPLEFYQTREAAVEQAVALLLSRYYSEMSGIAYNQNEKLNP